MHKNKFPVFFDRLSNHICHDFKMKTILENRLVHEWKVHTKIKSVAGFQIGDHFQKQHFREEKKCKGHNIMDHRRIGLSILHLFKNSQNLFLNNRQMTESNKIMQKLKV